MGTRRAGMATGGVKDVGYGKAGVRPTVAPSPAGGSRQLGGSSPLGTRTPDRRSIPASGKDLGNISRNTPSGRTSQRAMPTQATRIGGGGSTTGRVTPKSSVGANNPRMATGSGGRTGPGTTGNVTGTMPQGSGPPPVGGGSKTQHNARDLNPGNITQAQRERGSAIMHNQAARNSGAGSDYASRTASARTASNTAFAMSRMGGAGSGGRWGGGGGRGYGGGGSWSNNTSGYSSTRSWGVNAGAGYSSGGGFRGGVGGHWGGSSSRWGGRSSGYYR